LTFLYRRFIRFRVIGSRGSPTVTAKSKHALDGDIIRLARGVAIYKTHASPFWNARIRDNSTHKYVVRSTKETSRIKARLVAQEFAADLTSRRKAVPREFSFKHFATRFMEKGRRLAESGERNANYIRTARLSLDNDAWGLMRHFAERDVRELRTRDYFEFMNSLAKKRPDLSASTRNTLSATFRNVLKVARDEGVIDGIPATPRTRQKDNPRAFFRFHPLVPKERDAYPTAITTTTGGSRAPAAGAPLPSGSARALEISLRLLQATL
jgi:hypothetical protein